MKKGGLSQFIEEAVRWRVFHRTVQDIKARNAGTGPEELQALIDEAVQEVHAERQGKTDKPLLVMCPHPKNLDNSLLLQNLIDKPVLNIDTARVGSCQIADELFKSWVVLERIGS